MFELKISDRLDNVINLGLVQGKRMPGGNIAESAVARAYIAANHKCRRAVTPAFSAVGTHTAGTNRMEMLLIQKPYDLRSLETAREFDFEPVRFTAEVSLGSRLCLRSNVIIGNILGSIVHGYKE